MAKCNETQNYSLEKSRKRNTRSPLLTPHSRVTREKHDTATELKKFVDSANYRSTSELNIFEQKTMEETPGTKSRAVTPSQTNELSTNIFKNFSKKEQQEDFKEKPNIGFANIFKGFSVKDQQEQQLEEINEMPNIDFANVFKSKLAQQLAKKLREKIELARADPLNKRPNRLISYLGNANMGDKNTSCMMPLRIDTSHSPRRPQTSRHQKRKSATLRASASQKSPKRKNTCKSTKSKSEIPEYEPIDQLELRRQDYPKELLRRSNLKGRYDRSMEFEYNFDKVLTFCQSPLSTSMRHPMLKSGFDFEESHYARQCFESKRKVGSSLDFGLSSDAKRKTARRPSDDELSSSRTFCREAVFKDLSFHQHDDIDQHAFKITNPALKSSQRDYKTLQQLYREQEFSTKDDFQKRWQERRRRRGNNGPYSGHRIDY